MTEIDFAKGRKYLLHHRTSRQRYDRESVVEYTGLGFPSEDGKKVHLFKTDTSRTWELELTITEIISARDVPDSTETYINERWSHKTHTPIAPPQIPMPPPLPVRAYMKTWEQDETIIEAEIVEDAEDDIPEGWQTHLATDTALDLLNGDSALDDTVLYEARQRTIRQVLAMFFRYVDAGDVSEMPDDITTGIYKLFADGMDQAAIQMLYARWGIPDHKPGNRHVFAPWVPSLGKHQVESTKVDVLVHRGNIISAGRLGDR